MVRFVEGQQDFCERAVRMKECPLAPTVGTLDLRTFMGGYYEVGSTAGLKFKRELGMVCTRANFSVEDAATRGGQREDQDAGITMIHVVDSGLQVVGPQGMSALSKMASCAADVCANARRLCAAFVASSPPSSSKLADALARIHDLISQLRDSFPTTADRLTQTAGMVNATMQAAQARLDGLASAMTLVTGIMTRLNQAVGPVEELTGELRDVAGRAEEGARAMGTAMVANLTGARDMLLQDLQDFQNHDMMGGSQDTSAASMQLEIGVAEHIHESAALLEQQIDLASSQLSRMQGLLSSIAGTLVDMFFADRDSINSTSTLVAASHELVQHADQPGNMALKVDSSQVPYKLIALEGIPLIGYTSALVYSCQRDSNGDPNPDLLLLSRYPSLPPEIINRFLAIAQLNGIYTDCDGIFVPTIQRGETCGVFN